MKHIRVWITAIAALLFIIVWGAMGVKLHGGFYDVTVEACIALACLVVILVCAVSRLFTDKCPHCGKPRISSGKYCPHCGKEL